VSNAQNVTNGSRTKTRFAVGLKKKRPTMTTTPAVVEASVADEARAATILAEYADALAIVVRDTPVDLRAYLAPPGGLWLAHNGPGVVGCIALRRLATGSGEIKRLYVRPTHRGRGIADLLLDALESGARERGLCELYLDTHDGLLAAIRFYERRGYVRIERYNDNAQATVFMRRAIC